MTKPREWIRAISGACALLLLLGTVISFFLDPYVPEDVKNELPDGALSTDSARAPWLSVDENGMARVHSERCTYLKEMVIPEAINGIKVTSFYCNLEEAPSWIEKITLPSTMREVGEFPFHNWTALKEIVFKEGIEDLSLMYIGTKPNLEKLVLPSTVTSLRKDVLNQTPETLVIHFGGTEEQWLAIGSVAKTLSEKYTVIYESDGSEPEEKPETGADAEEENSAESSS